MFSLLLRGTPGVHAREESHPELCGAERRSFTPECLRSASQSL
jgi:hypothetical protein